MRTIFGVHGANAGRIVENYALKMVSLEAVLESETQSVVTQFSVAIAPMSKNVNCQGVQAGRSGNLGPLAASLVERVGNQEFEAVRALRLDQVVY